MVALFPPAQSLAYSYAYVVTHKNKIEKKKNKQEMENQTKSVNIFGSGIAAAVAATSGKKGVTPTIKSSTNIIINSKKKILMEFSCL